MHKFLLLACLLAVFCGVYGQAVKTTWYDYDYSDAEWSGPNVIFMITSQAKKLYRSVDEGATWAVQTLPGNVTAISSMHRDSKDSTKFIFVVDGLRQIVTTTNSGESYTLITLPGRLEPRSDSIKFNPQITGFFLVAVDCASYYCDYYVSKDFGANFAKVFNGDADSTDWDRLPQGASDTILTIDRSANLVYTSDFGKTFNVIQKFAIQFLLTRHHIYVLMVDPETLSEVNLYAATDNCITPSGYQEAEFPFGDDLAKWSYTFLDDTTGSEWIGVVHSRDFTSPGTIYSSDATGAKFTTALRHAHRVDMYFDFARVHGLEGIYIANNVTNYDQPSNNPQLTTVITLDNGGEWRYLTPPSKNSEGKDIVCTGKCHLHLHGLTTWVSTGSFGPVYSSHTAIGLIIGTGTIGEYLNPASSAVNTYLSRDAGLTWQELMTGSHIYEFGDHGGIIVFADNTKPTSTVWYTLDEGLTIKSLTLDNPVKIENIVSESSGISRKFILYSDTQVIGLDFTQAQPRICADADYEEFIPTDGRENGDSCQLGRTVVYSRRKQSSNCYNNRTADHAINSTNCQCALEDYECDFGYEEEMIDGKPACILNTVNPPADPPKDCPPGTKYQRSRGYRRVAGDSCINDLTALLPYDKICPDAAAGAPKSNAAMIAVVVIFVLLAVFGVVGFFVYRNDEWRERILDVVGKVIPINRGPSYSRIGRQALVGDEEFGIGGDHVDDDDDVEEDAPELHDADIQRATTREDFNPRS